MPGTVLVPPRACALAAHSPAAAQGTFAAPPGPIQGPRLSRAGRGGTPGAAGQGGACRVGKIKRGYDRLQLSQLGGEEGAKIFFLRFLP